MSNKSFSTDVDFPELDPHRPLDKPDKSKHILHLYTHKNHQRKLVTTAYVQTLEDYEDTVFRSFEVFGDFTKTLTSVDMPRYNVKRAEAQHESVINDDELIEIVKHKAIEFYLEKASKKAQELEAATG